jgi:leucyl aminopeptidase
MNVGVTVSPLDREPADLVVFGLAEKERPASDTPLGRADAALGGTIGEAVETKEFSGKAESALMVHTLGRLPAKRVLVTGLGPRERLDGEVLRRAAGVAAKRARDCGAKWVVSGLVDCAPGLGAELAAQAVVEGTLLALYRYDAYKHDEGEERATDPESLSLILSAEKGESAARAGAERGRVIAESVTFARDLINAPPNEKTPTVLAEQARAMATECGLAVEVWNAETIRAQGMEALLAVAQGSAQEPRFMIVRHEPPGMDGQPPVVLVGKGVTFDTGGISIKPAQGMDKMKYDMAGAAAALGAVRAIGLLKAPRRVVALAPLTENAVSGTALRPGDVIGSLGGKSIEITNTDAEGRLILADALAYAKTFEPAAVIDLATLTGGVTVALGAAAMGLMATDDALAERILASGERTGERAWRLPLWDDYAELLKSEVADIKNSGGREAHAIQGGMFLKRFIEGAPWAHLDIANVAWTDKAHAYCPVGAVGIGVRLLVDVVRSF